MNGASARVALASGWGWRGAPRGAGRGRGGCGAAVALPPATPMTTTITTTTTNRRPRCRGRVALLLAVLALGLAGCETTPTVGESGDVAMDGLVTAGDWATLAGRGVSCSARSEECAKAHARKGDACLRLVIEQPPDASDKDARVRELLDCAEDGYRKALARQTSVTGPGRESYHGGLLLTLSERRNRLDSQSKDKKLDRENEKLMIAAQDARRETAASALGYLYGASAHAYRAMLKPRGGDRCPDLRQAEMLLQRSPPPPPELLDEEQRIASLVGKELRASGCPRIVRR